MDIYGELGLETIINAAGTLTRLGGSLMLPEVIEAMAAAGRAFATCGCVPGRFAGYHIVRRVNQGKQIFFRRTAAGRKGNAAHTRNLEEGSTIHIKYGLPDQKTR